MLVISSFDLLTSALVYSSPLKICPVQERQELYYPRRSFTKSVRYMLYSAMYILLVIMYYVFKKIYYNSRILYKKPERVVSNIFFLILKRNFELLFQTFIPCDINFKIDK